MNYKLYEEDHDKDYNPEDDVIEECDQLDSFYLLYGSASKVTEKVDDEDHTEEDGSEDDESEDDDLTDEDDELEDNEVEELISSQAAYVNAQPELYWRDGKPVGRADWKSSASSSACTSGSGSTENSGDEYMSAEEGDVEGQEGVKWQSGEVGEVLTKVEDGEGEGQVPAKVESKEDIVVKTDTVAEEEIFMDTEERQGAEGVVEKGLGDLSITKVEEETIVSEVKAETHSQENQKNTETVEQNEKVIEDTVDKEEQDKVDSQAAVTKIEATAAETSEVKVEAQTQEKDNANE